MQQGRSLIENPTLKLLNGLILTQLLVTLDVSIIVLLLVTIIIVIVIGLVVIIPRC